MTQYGYDPVGRPKCTAVRMNPSTYGALPGDACAQASPGSAGPDRIAQTDYEYNGAVAATYTGVGTSLARRDAYYTHSDNGKVTSLTDARGNVTTYSYDGFDRPTRTAYPNASGGGSSASDYMEVTYGTGTADQGLVVSRRLRNGQSFSYGYDALGRVTGVTPPQLTWEDVPIGLAYNNLGQVTQVNDTVYGHNASYSYDALGRVKTEGGPWSSKTMSYDAAGRLTGLDYGGGYAVSYGYDALGEMTGVYENGTTLLASYGYDDLGRRTSLARANGVTTTYAYAATSPWLQSQTMAFPTASNNQVITFAYNPAGQITSRAASNDLYAWTGHYNVNRGYTANGLNQYTQSGSVTPTYDALGNLTSAGTTAYSYSARNLLIDASGKGLYYDALGRLDIEYSGSPALLDYTGSQATTERDINNGGNVLRRYVYGAGDDEPLVWYEGSGTRELSDQRGRSGGWLLAGLHAPTIESHAPFPVSPLQLVA